MEIRNAFCICNRVNVGIDHSNVAKHAVVNVAAERHDAVVLENHRIRCLAFVQRQYEVVRSRERVDMMCNNVAVRERNSCTPLYHQNVRVKTYIALIHNAGRRFCCRFHPALSHEYSNIRDGRTVRVNDVYLQVFSPRGRQHEAQQDRGGSTQSAVFRAFQHGFPSLEAPRVMQP